MVDSKILSEAFAVAKYLKGAAFVKDALECKRQIPKVKELLELLDLEIESNGLASHMEKPVLELPSEDSTVNSQPCEQVSEYSYVPTKRPDPLSMERSTKVKLWIGALIMLILLSKWYWGW